MEEVQPKTKRKLEIQIPSVSPGPNASIWSKIPGALAADRLNCAQPENWWVCFHWTDQEDFFFVRATDQQFLQWFGREVSAWPVSLQPIFFPSTGSISSAQVECFRSIVQGHARIQVFLLEESIDSEELLLLNSCLPGLHEMRKITLSGYLKLSKKLRQAMFVSGNE